MSHKDKINELVDFLEDLEEWEKDVGMKDASGKKEFTKGKLEGLKEAGKEVDDEWLEALDKYFGKYMPKEYEAFEKKKEIRNPEDLIKHIKDRMEEEE